MSLEPQGVRLVNVQSNSAHALNTVLTDEQADKVWVVPGRLATTCTVIFEMSVDEAHEMVASAMDDLADQGLKRGFPHQSLHSVRRKLDWIHRHTASASDWRPVPRFTFGYNKGVPAGTTAAWGAWVDITFGYFDLRTSSQSVFGPKDEVDALLDRLNITINLQWMARVEQLRRAKEMSPRVEHEFELYADANVTVVGNTMGRNGFLHVAAFPTPRTRRTARAPR